MVWQPHIASSSFGLSGFDHITTTAATSGEWYAIRAVNGDAVGDFHCDANDSLTTFTILDGDYLFGPFDTITLSSGEVLAYRTKRGD